MANEVVTEPQTMSFWGEGDTDFASCASETCIWHSYLWRRRTSLVSNLKATTKELQQPEPTVLKGCVAKTEPKIRRVRYHAGECDQFTPKE